MSSAGNQESDFKKTLLTRLLAGVKGCQSRFGSRSELATEDDESVARLCAAYEDVFSHGLQKKTSLQSSSSKANFWMPAALRSSDTTSFWPLIKSQLSKHESERFLLLHNVRTDAGRCRAWIRASLNEHSLERYILIILSLQDLHEYYEDFAFLRDHELNSLLPQTAAGLGSVLFALTVDSPKLDTFVHVMEKDVPEATVIHEDAQEAIEIADQAILALSPNSLSQNNSSSVALAKPSEKVLTEDKGKSKSCKKKKKKPPVNFVSFDDDDDQTGSVDSLSLSTSGLYSSLPGTTVSTPTEKRSQQSFTKESNDSAKLPSHATTNTPVKVGEKMSESKNTANVNDSNTTSDHVMIKDSENDSSEPSTESPYSIPIPSRHSTDGTGGGLESSLCSTSVKSVDCISVNSVYSDCSERLDLESANIAGLEISPSQRLKPIVNDNSGEFSIKHTNNPDSTHDLIPVPSYDSALTPALNLDVEQHCAGSSGSSKIHSPITPTTPGRSNDSTISGKEQGQSRRASGEQHHHHHSSSALNEEAIQKLKGLLDREIETVATLRAELAEEKRSSNNQIKILEAKIESLSKENEILRHQLKKYVGAVQLLKREGSRRLSLEDDDAALNNGPTNDIDDASHEAAEYERKLIQVAEMHGELMEFNSHLQRSIQRKDAAIKRLKEELVDLRGPLATPLIPGGEEDDDDDSWDIVESFSADHPGGGGAIRSGSGRRVTNTHSNERVLINIWIPSAFLTGATNDLHHVYQVFVRIKDTEWNIYRRYSQFYSLHRDLSKSDPVVASLYFPPKKHLGNKDAKFVDERRRKLQDYLRAVVNHSLQTNSVLASHPEKNLLISILPFFGESFNRQTQKPKRERSRSRSLFFRQSAQPTQQPSQGQLQFSHYPQYTGL